MGHGSCGGAAASLDHAFADAAPGEGGFIRNWVALLDEARDEVLSTFDKGPEATRAMEHATVRVSLKNLMSFPFVRERVEAGELTLHGSYFAIADGVLHVLDEETDDFVPA